MQINKPDYYNDLDKIYTKAWDLLSFGLQNRDNPLHIPVFINGVNNDFDGRVIVLRGLDKNNKSLWFHSDIRSNKVKDLKINPKGTFLFYSKEEKVQLRITGNIKIHYKNDFTEKSWKKTAHMSRQCYLGENPPGLVSKIPTSGLSEDIDNSKYTIEESEIGYKNFCVIENYIKSIEWLYLAAKGHRRAHFSLENSSIKKKWLIP